MKEEFILEYCKVCIQMTNHMNDVCQKCKRENNRRNMISLCEGVIKFHSNSKSMFADINKLIWIKKLKWWKSLN